jgi:hypothetical protein
MAKQMRYGWLPCGFLDKQEYRIKLDNLRSDLQWAKRAAPEKVPEIKNKILEFVGTQSWMDGKQFHAKIDPLLDEKFEILMQMHELEMFPSPGPVHDRGDGKDDLPREGQADLGALEPPEAPDLRAEGGPEHAGRELQPPHAREDQD